MPGSSWMCSAYLIYLWFLYPFIECQSMSIDYQQWTSGRIMWLYVLRQHVVTLLGVSTLWMTRIQQHTCPHVRNATRYLGCYHPGGLLRQRCGTWTISRDDYKVWWTGRFGTVGALDDPSFGAIGMHHGSSSIRPANRPGRRGHPSSLFADSRQGYQGWPEVWGLRLFLSRCKQSWESFWPGETFTYPPVQLVIHPMRIAGRIIPADAYTSLWCTQGCPLLMHTLCIISIQYFLNWCVHALWYVHVCPLLMRTLCIISTSFVSIDSYTPCDAYIVVQELCIAYAVLVHRCSWWCACHFVPRVWEEPRGVAVLFRIHGKSLSRTTCISVSELKNEYDK